MKENKFLSFVDNNLGTIIGVLIGIIIYFCDFLHKFFMLVLFVLVSGMIGNYVHRNKSKVKEFLKNLIDKM